jgi:hypothetical protein
MPESSFYSTPYGQIPGQYLGRQNNVVGAATKETNVIRVHDEAMKTWVNKCFIHAPGYPIPAVFADPMDAFSSFKQAWTSKENPYKYLTELTDKSGTPIYSPDVSGIIYPLISIKRGGVSFDVTRNFSPRMFRNLGFPTVSDDVTDRDLGNVLSARMPMGWNISYQIDFYSNRPDTQAYFYERLMRELVLSAATTEFWIPVQYHGWWGQRLVCVQLEGNIENNTEISNEEVMVYRTTAQFKVMGWRIDAQQTVMPALWTSTVSEKSGSTTVSSETTDLRPDTGTLVTE